MGNMTLLHLEAPTMRLQVASDTGARDNITSLTNLGFDVEAKGALITDTVTYRLYKSDTLMGTVTTIGNTVTFAGVSATDGTDAWTVTYQVGSQVSNVSAPETVTVDLFAPSLASPTGVKTGQTTATIGVTVAQSGGDLFWVADTNLNTPSGPQIIAGQDQAGATADKSGSSLAVVGTGVKTFNLTGLTASTTYKGHFAYRDAAYNISSPVSSAAFTTDSAAATLTTLYEGALACQAPTSGVSFGPGDCKPIDIVVPNVACSVYVVTCCTGAAITAATLAAANPTVNTPHPFLGAYSWISRWDYAAGNGGTKQFVVTVNVQTICVCSILITSPSQIGAGAIADVWNPAAGTRTWPNITVPAGGRGLAYDLQIAGNGGFDTPANNGTYTPTLSVASSSSAIYTIDANLPWNNVFVTNANTNFVSLLSLGIEPL